MKDTVGNKRVISLTGIRFYLAFSVFFAHIGFIRCSDKGKWLFTNVFADGGFAVTFFFILSGYGLFLGYKNRFHIITVREYVTFIKKRLRKLYPAYILSMWSVLIYSFIGWDKSVDLSIRLSSTLLKMLWAATMTQSWIYTIYSRMGNGPAWFVSCIFFCYLIAPIAIKAVNKLIDTMYDGITYMAISFITLSTLLLIYFRGGLDRFIGCI